MWASGVLEPLQAAPVIVEDGAFIGSRCIGGGVRVGREAKRSRANVVLTASTHFGSRPRACGDAGCHSAPGGRHSRHTSEGVPGWHLSSPVCPDVGERKESTDRKTSLTEALREHDVAV